MIFALFAVSFQIISACNSTDESERPNIIFILTDDQRWDAFHFSGTPQLITPNLDQLAAEGVVFTNAFHAVPICEPSRASIMLSQYPSRHRCGFDRPTDYAISREEFSKSYPVVLRKSGYYTGFVGKFGFPVANKKVPNVADYDPRVKNSRDPNTQLWWYDKYMPSDEFDYWKGVPGQNKYTIDGRHGTLVRGEQAAEFIRLASGQDKPFCLSVSLKAPHAPFTAESSFLALYDTVEMFRYFNDKKAFQDLLPGVVKNHYRGVKNYQAEDDAEWLDYIKNYFGLITGADWVLGTIREELRKQGVDENTVILFTSDNGWFSGSKGLEGKDLLYEESLRAPLIIYDPRMPLRDRASTRSGLVSTIDFAPSMIELAGVEIPGTMDGVSFLKMLYGESNQTRSEIFAENNFARFSLTLQEAKDENEKEALLKEGTVRSRCIRTARFKYIRYYETSPMVEELWAIDVDPLETNNLVGNPVYLTALKKMRGLCDDYMEHNEINQK